LRRTAQTIEAHNSVKAEKRGRASGRRERGPDKKKRKIHEKSVANLRPYPKGVSGNPGGLPGTDVAAKIARRIFEENEAAIYAGMAKQLISGKAYDFDVLATRAYGKKTTIEHTGEGGGPIEHRVRLVRPKGILSEMK
jgi:hypothetical protein